MRTSYLLEMGINYEPFLEIQNKLGRQIRKAAQPWIIGFLVLVGVFFLIRRYIKF